jgi:signal transduction histidine kinase
MIEGFRGEQARKSSLEALRIAKNEAERANNAKSEFLSRITHELRTPLNAIIGFSQLMETDTVDVLPPSHQENVEQILKAGWHLRHLIDQVLDLSQIEAGRAELEQVPCNLAEQISESLMLVSSLAQQRGIALNFMANTESPHLLADPTRVKQILTNLLSNAVKYNRPEGQVNVSVISTPKEWGVAVTDTGRGIAPNDLERIFIPFARVGDKKAVSGIGIGLDISRRFAELMGGRIDAVSELGVGSTFTLWLPQEAN